MRTYLLLTGTMFSVVALAHGVRLAMSWPIQLAGWSIPMWLSWPAIAVTASLAIWAFRLSRSRQL